MTALRGITWDHPRAYQPLEALQKRSPTAPPVVWDRQPLAGFEAHPISDLAQTYDLIVLDHPGLGAAVDADALHPLEALFGDNELAAFEANLLPVTWQSYHFHGSQWALPIDASTQVMVLRPDLMPVAPTTWADVIALSRAIPFTLCLGGPHALLHLLALCAPRTATPCPLLPLPAAWAGLNMLQLLWRRCDQQTSLLDPIGVHEALAGTDDLAYCPLVYGYAKYSLPVTGAKALQWADAPAAVTGATPGSVLGGTGLAVSRRATPERVRAWIRAYLAEEVQTVLVPATGGQPAYRRIWEQAEGPLSAYCAATRSSMLNAWIRPRANGWIAVQEKASEVVRDCVTAGSSTIAATAEINRLYADNVAPGDPR
jgi:multiple sugar transport system substrate-binding protein